MRSFALYGDTTGETDEFGLPVRYPWANDYRGSAMVLYGHTPTPEPEWVNNTMCLDTGCVFGGSLTALRYPEREIVSVPAEQVWYEPAKPFLTDDLRADAGSTATLRDPDVLDITDVLGKRVVETAHHGRVTVREENAAGALEVMSRFAIEPRWLLYLPPTMAPCATSSHTDLLEHPDEAFEAFRSDGVAQVLCEEKHMGSRAVVLICRDEAVAASRFGASDGATGAVYTRTGRPFFPPALTEQLLARLRDAAGTAGLWDELATGWVLLDCELLPWSAKAGDLLASPVRGGRGGGTCGASRCRIRRARDGGRAGPRRRRPAHPHPLPRGQRRCLHRGLPCATSGRPTAWTAYGWRLSRSSQPKVRTYHHTDHAWHLGIADRLVGADPDLMQSTQRLLVDTTDPASTEAGVVWWESLTEHRRRGHGRQAAREPHPGPEGPCPAWREGARP